MSFSSDYNGGWRNKGHDIFTYNWLIDFECRMEQLFECYQLDKKPKILLA